MPVLQTFICAADFQKIHVRQPPALACSRVDNDIMLPLLESLSYDISAIPFLPVLVISADTLKYTKMMNTNYGKNLDWISMERLMSLGV